MTLRVYIAAPLSASGDASCWGVILRRTYEVTSRWHDIVPRGAQDPTSRALRQSVLLDNIDGLHAADCVLAVLVAGFPRATFAEIGYALAQGKPVVWLGRRSGSPTCLFDAHPLVSRVVDDEAVLRVLEQLSKVAT